MFSTLNEEQKTAVHLPLDVNALIVAGAGSGKTRVLIARIVYLLKNNIAPESILAVTFTNKAAKEMLDRLGKMLGERARAVWVGTFHGIAFRILKRHAKEAGLSPNFQIMDADDQKALIKRILKEQFAYLKEDNDEEETANFSPSVLASWINRQKEKGYRPGDVLKNCDAWLSKTQNMQEHVKVYQAYERACAAEAVVDFAELLLRVLELFKNNEMIRQRYQMRFKHILVDEFQDINDLQFQWMSLWAKGGPKLFVVGDDDQSIYGWRGANVNIFRQFEKHFAARTVQLGQNYRSTPIILEAANRLIKHNPDRMIEKDLWTQKIGGDLVRCHCANNAKTEAEFVVSEIEKLHQSGVALSHIAVLYRINALSRQFEMAFIGHKIKYFIYGGLGFFSREEIKHMLAYLHLVANPDDNGAFWRIANVPKRGIGNKMMENLRDWALVENVSLFQMASRANEKMHAKFKPLLEVIHEARTLIQTQSLLEVCQFLLEKIDFKTHYEKKEKDKEKRTERLANLGEFLTAVRSFMEDNTPDKSTGELSSFLSYAALFASEHQNSKEDAVQMMSVHASKGLEFPCVFVVGAEEGIFPHERATESFEEESLYEERRLFYVAITRAQDKLFLSYSRERPIYAQNKMQTPSSFLEELQTNDSSVFYNTAESPLFPTSRFSAAFLKHSARVSEAKNRYGQRLIVGQPVCHPKYGTGLIVRFIEGKGLGTVKIAFNHLGLKEFDLNMADLKPV